MARRRPAGKHRNGGVPITLLNRRQRRAGGRLRGQMRDPRQHFLLQQPQRVLPGTRIVLVVKAEDQQLAEAADFVVDRSSFSATVFGEPTSQLCSAQYSGVTSSVRHLGSCFR